MYDKRGNLTETRKNGALTHQYIYGTLNRLEKTVNAAGETAKYQYHGLGHRGGKEIILDPTKQLSGQSQKPDSRIDYLIDLTREYHNLLEKTEDGISQTYFWDGNVAAFEERGKRSYYLQDELGSPLRIEDELGLTRETYGYGAFGEDLYGNQGVLQVFGYTGYQRDNVAGTYYAQAREYSVETGRFCGRDIYPGIGYLPKSIHEYVYCQLNPLKYIDLNGKWITTLIGGIVGGVAGAVGGLVGELTDDKPGIDWGNVAIDAVTGVATGAVVGTFPLSAPALLGRH